ncbi:hypothetical protein [Vibrio nigripulchritudo]|uniref:hypothetical protein n=1 Tax=Vibrio nigripulchritudo TaxID=28173 RepID=UPI0003B1CBDB|nr:hypothetical protein [Vibrio nigripulchritudo]CCN69659.1 membrane hypothetical protein [Vibrio nigripulchritudo SFn118]
MTLGVLFLLSFLHIAIWVASPFIIFIWALKQKEFELSKHNTDICIALWGAYSILTIVSIILVSYYYLVSSQASYQWWFVMPWTSLAVLIVYIMTVSKIKPT